MEIYKIAVALQMQSNASGVLAAISKDVLKLNSSVSTLQKSLGRIGPALTAGLATFAASGILTAMKTATDYGKELLDQQDRLIRAGRSHAEVASLTAKAYAQITRQVPTATGADILRTANQLNVVTGSWSKAVAATPEALKVEALLANLTGQDATGAGHSLWRSLEMKGLTGGNAIQQALAQKLLDLFVQDIAASGGKLTARDFLNAAKTGGAYWQRANPDFLAGPGAVVMADLGGDRFGTALASLGQFMSGALTMSRQQYQALRSVGMIDPHKVSVDRGGRINTSPGAIVGSLQYGDDPYDWVQKVLLPHLSAAGVKPGPEEDSILSKVGRNRNVIRMLTMFSDPGFVSQIEKDLRVFRQSKGLDASYDSYVKNDPKGVDSAFAQQYRSMMQAVGAPLEQAAIPVMSAITSMFTSIGEFAQRHPHVVQELGLDALFGPLGQLAQDFKQVDNEVAPLHKYLASIPADIVGVVKGFHAGVADAFAMPFTPQMLAAQKAGLDQFVTSLDHLLIAVNPLDAASSAAANAIEKLLHALGSIAGGVIGAFKGFEGKIWGAPATDSQGKNPIFHENSFIGPASDHAMIHAALITPVSGPRADQIRKWETASANIVPRRQEKRDVLVPVELKVDGKTLAKVVARQQYAATKYPLGIHGGPDDYGSWVSPGNSMQPV